MCGRYAFFTPWAAVRAKIGAKLADERPVPRYNIPPGAFISAVLRTEDASSPILGQLWWGYKPHWAGDKAPQPIDATIEKVDTSSYFKQAYAHSRCVVPADGWYEWDKSVDPKQPHFICREDRKLPGLPPSLPSAVTESLAVQLLLNRLKESRKRSMTGCL